MNRRTLRLALATAFALALTLVLGAVPALADNTPSVSGEEASSVGVTTLRLSGKVNPNGEAGAGNTSWRIEYSLAGQEAWNVANAGTIEPPASEEGKDVEVEAIFGFSGELQPGESYEFRLVAENGAGTDQTAAPYPTFTMDEATVPTLAAKKTTPVGYTSATLHGTVNPQGGNVNPMGGVIPIYWSLEYREVGQPSWTSANGLTEISGTDAESPTALPVSAEIPPGTLHAAKTYEVQVFAYYLNFNGQTVSPAIPLVTFTTKAATAPTLSVEDASAISGTSAHASGTVNANAPILSSPTPEEEADVHAAFDSYCYFEYVTDATYKELGNAFPNEPPAFGCEPTNPVTGSSPTAVNAEVGGLEPHTKYRLRLRAENQGGKTYLEATPFTTEAVPPTIASTFVESVGDDGATLNAKIVPGGAPTTYHFQYVTQAQYGAPVEGGFAKAITTPESVSIGEDNLQHIAFAPIGGLEPDTTYVYRVVATNSKGTIEGDVRQLHTFALPSEAPDTCPNSAFRSDQQSAFLPDCRAYEMVSPPDKRGGDVVAMTERTHMATDGNAASFASLVAFGDAAGTGVATEYMALRDGAPATNGWATHAITPLQEGMGVNETVVFDSLYVGDLSDDLNRGVFRTLTPLTNDPNVSEVPNLYLRDDLRSPGAGTYQLLSPCPLCDLPGGTPLPTPATDFLQPLYAGASDDFSHLLFQQKVNLTSDAPTQPDECNPETNCMPRAYEWSGGQLRLAGLVPSGSATSCGGGNPPCVVADASIVGAGDGRPSLPNRPLSVISADGGKFFFTVPMRPDGVIDGRQKAGKLYMRSADTMTDQINASERADCVGDPGAPSCFSPALYLTASADGSRVFFFTEQTLTDAAPGGGIYMYDTTKLPSDPHNLTFVASGSGLVNASEDGSYVYFFFGNQVELWHEDTVVDVGGPADPFETPNTGTSAGTLTHARVSPDGRYLLLPLHNSQGFRELYLYSADTDKLTCVSCPTDGTTPSGDAQVALRENKGAAAATWHLNRAISADGDVFFTSPDPLVPGDTNGRKDAYTYDAQTNEVHLLSSGTSKSDSYFLEADPDGSNALIVTREQLVGWDNDNSYDLYDARVEGGFPEPADPPDICPAETCRAPVPPSPNATPTTSSDIVGHVDPEPNRPSCPKGKRAVRRHGKTRCVKNRRHARTRANTNRRASR